jgi:hypothetical protein
VFVATRDEAAQRAFVAQRLHSLASREAAFHVHRKSGAPRPSCSLFPAVLILLSAFHGSKRTYGRPVVTVTVDTGGIDAAAAATLESRAKELGAVEHHIVAARGPDFDRRAPLPLIGNARRGHDRPLLRGCRARSSGTDDCRDGKAQVRRPWPTAAQPPATTRCALKSPCATLAPGLEIIAPVRDRAFKRPEQLAFLEERGLPIPPYGAAYSVNRGLWGVTIGGKETLTSNGSIPDDAWVLTRGRVYASKRTRASYDRLHARRAHLARRSSAGSGHAHRNAGDLGVPLRYWTWHSSG